MYGEMGYIFPQIMDGPRVATIVSRIRNTSS